MLYDIECELCKLVQKTKWYYSSDEFAIVDCINCKIPMAVTYKHISPHARDLVVNQLRIEMEDKLEYIARIYYKTRAFYIDKEQYHNKTHLHWHARAI